MIGPMLYAALTKNGENTITANPAEIGTLVSDLDDASGHPIGDKIKILPY